MTSTPISSLSTTWEPLRLTHTKPSFNNHELALASRQDLWHKFIIFDAGNYDMEIVLDAVALTCQPEVILPVMYQVDNAKKGTFLAKCSIATIESFVQQNLQIVVGENQVLNMDIVLGFISMQELKMNLHRIIADVLFSRWDPAKKTLNLENFCHDKGLGPVYCPILSVGVFVFVLKCCKSQVNMPRETKLPIKELILRQNKLSGVSLYEKLFGYSLSKLDLSHNRIENIDYLRYFTEFKITEVKLDGNPLCSQFSTVEDYIQAVRYVFPYVQKIDGVTVDLEQKRIPLSQPYFLADESSISLIKQFIEHYFTLFDQKDRVVLHGLYESDSSFSATFGEIANPRHRLLTKTLNVNRNLLKVVDYSRCYKYLFRGPAEIVDCLRRLPPTYHDYKTFNIDVIYKGSNYFILAIQGSFYYREFPISLQFNRTFIVVEKEDNEYRIVNDQYHIQSGNSTMMDSRDCSKLSLKNIPSFEPKIMSDTEKGDLLKFLANVTTMNSTYCKEYLLKTGWDLRAAISLFMKTYTVNDVPPKAFE